MTSLTCVWSLVRRHSPLLIFLALGAVMLFGQTCLLNITTAASAADPLGMRVLNADGAQITAVAQAGGWVQLGAVTSKLLTAAGAFLFFTVVRWSVQHLTHPYPTSWAKAEYKEEFQLLTRTQRFHVYQNIRQDSVWLALASLLFAAVVQ
ncbi:hypothetical protein [Hymenobacter siberiensis]|uniref:hypothetical protein n=1 Tax=Hymenobacter siberiensis TaxID=2848396 RepID=UPI001C1E5D6F|nr:hypothetical protein [Hymenobacter siberiensis]